MPSNFTENYNLNQWERTDQVKMEDFNADNAKLDAALSQKADQSALDALAQTVTGHTAALSKKGNVQVRIYTYTGTGTCGEDGACTIPFNGTEPLLVLIFGRSSDDLLLHRGLNETNNYSNYCQVTWKSTGVSWYAFKNAEYQLNVQGWSYTALMFYKLG